MQKLNNKFTKGELRVKNIVFESPSFLDKRKILSIIKKGYRVYVIEPFNAYHHHNQGIKFFPPSFPEYIYGFIYQGHVKLLRADALGSRELNLLAAERAVESVEPVFLEYRKDYPQLISFFNKTLKSDEAEMIFKKNLCDQLGDFYSLNIMLHNIRKALDDKPTIIFTPANIQKYLYLECLIARSHQDYFNNEYIFFSFQSQAKGSIKNMLKSIKITFKLILLIIGGILISKKHLLGKEKKKKYRYGISIISPSRQLRDNQRGPDFIIDHHNIKIDETVYLPLADLDRSQKQKLSDLASDIYYLPQKGRFFSNWKEWARLLFLSFKEKFLHNTSELEMVASGLFSYFRWKFVLQNIGLDNFITHCDFAINHIPRNILLKQYGVKTWYFTDATNFGHNFREDNFRWNRHPFWTYLYYDNFVTWHKDLADYFSLHPQSFQNTYIVGSLWSEHARFAQDRKKYLAKYFENEIVKDKFVISVFSSTYTVKSITSYEEAILFARHLKNLISELSDILIIFKEKKDGSMHLKLEPRLGKKLLELYDSMDRNPRIKICSKELDASTLMGISDMCISFPFTSTTIEALGITKPAIWHDPMGYYKNTPYGRLGGVVTHSYDDLKAKVFDVKNLKAESYQNPIPPGSPLIDNYRDGNAIGRFRKLLLR